MQTYQGRLEWGRGVAGIQMKTYALACLLKEKKNPFGKID